MLVDRVEFPVRSFEWDILGRRLGATLERPERCDHPLEAGQVVMVYWPSTGRDDSASFWHLRIVEVREQFAVLELYLPCTIMPIGAHTEPVMIRWEQECPTPE